ncbi:hypothetical protein L207DRAFT_591952 [Hyaloscypha variabilis F]|uniref:Uncharacterized protein n=1 Tax=Hyaloscypha variabilis (strain UAMH 11265 / GT02V1 / F) TaxID=1149755 RepID=A0A2J6QXL1_HYAVF|nr:hypothetical protein L207DRAFT_591952 [Hyaloscypha variabilis F]
MSATIILAVPIGYGNWPPATGLANLTQAQRDSYTRRLTLLNVIEQINLFLPGYHSPARAFSGGNARAAQLLMTFNNQYAATINRQAYTTVHSLRSSWSHGRQDMLRLINLNSALTPVLPAAPGPVAVGQQQQAQAPAQQPPARTPLPSSRPNSAIPAQGQDEEDEEEDDEEDDDEEEEDEDEDEGDEIEWDAAGKGAVFVYSSS